MKESESKQSACNLEMPNGLHGIDYPQRFVKAPLSQHPSKAPYGGKECEPARIMREVCHAK